MSDSNFDALANISSHISSFSASASDGNVLQNTSKFRPETGLAAYQLISDSSQLGKSTPELQQDKLKRITGKYDLLSPHIIMHLQYQMIQSTALKERITHQHCNTTTEVDPELEGKKMDLHVD